MDNNNLQAGLANINAKADFKAEAKVADTFNTQIGGTTNNNDYSSNSVVNQEFYINIFPNLNCKESILKALSLGNNNALFVGTDVQKLLSRNGITEQQVQEKLSNPEILATIAKANKIAYITSDIEKRKILSDLIFSKIKTNESEESNTLSLAIKAMDNLTHDHLKAIAFLFLFHSGYVKNNITISELLDFNDKYLKILTNIPEQNLRNVGITVIANGCAVTYTFGSNINEYLPDGLYLKNGEFNSETAPEIANLVKNLNLIWSKLGTSSASLTPLGECLGKKYLADVLGLYINNEIKHKNPTENTDKLVYGDVINGGNAFN